MTASKTASGATLSDLGGEVCDAFRAAMETRDVDGAVALFADDATFHSPVVHQHYTGREMLHDILTAVATVFEDFHYTASYTGQAGHVLEFEARVGDRSLQGVDILKSADGVLTGLTVMVRPYSAATALRQRMAARFAQQTAPTHATSPAAVAAPAAESAL